jgi:hypothetical protein
MAALAITASPVVASNLSQPFSYYQARGSHTTSKVVYGNRGAYYPTDPPVGAKLGVYVFCVGTAQTPANYKATLDHVASHGFVAVGVGNAVGGGTCTEKDIVAAIDELKVDSKLPAVLRGKVNASNIVAGGHSGGGPCAIVAAAQRGSVVRGFIAQHSAAIPSFNRPTDAVIKAIPGAIMVLCGSLDIMPFCGCSYAENDYYQRLATTLPRVKVKVKGASHVDGTEGKSGDMFEGGYVVAFLHTILKEDANAGRAILASGRDTQESAAWPPPTEELIV